MININARDRNRAIDPLKYERRMLSDMAPTEEAGERGTLGALKEDHGLILIESADMIAKLENSHTGLSDT